MLDVYTQAEILSTFPFIEGRRDGPEGALYRHDRTGHEILRIVRDIDDERANSVARDDVSLSLIVDEPPVVLGSKVGDSLPWAGASSHWHRVRHSERISPTPAMETFTGSRIDLMLLEGKGGGVRASRSLTLPTDLTRVLNEAILEQSRFNDHPAEERRATEALLRRGPTPASLAGRACIKTTISE